MSFSLKNNLLNNNIFIILILFFYTLIWFISNDAFYFHRDEMWYASYSVSLSDYSTNDIRHIIPIDLHQIAFLPVFRFLQGFIISIFGENIYGLRIINLAFILSVLYLSIRLFIKLEISRFLIIFFVLIIMFEPQVMMYSHKARPDFIIACLGLISVIYIINFLLYRKVYFLYSSSFFSVLALSMYWNGLAVIFSTSLTILIFYLKKYVSINDLLKLSFFTLFFLIIFFLLPIYLNYDSFFETFTNIGVKSSSGTFHILNIFYMIKQSLIGSKYQSILLFIVLFYIISWIIINKTNISIIKKEILFVCMYFFIAILLVLSLRSDSSRHLYMFLPIFYLAFILNINLLFIKVKKMKKLTYLTLTIIVVLFTLNSSRYIYNNFGQQSSYDKYSYDINHTIIKDDVIVLTTFDLTWAVDNPKFYLENFLFKNLSSKLEFVSIISNYDIEYMLIDETTRSRLDNHPKKQIWYKYLNEYLNSNYKLKTVFFNKFYRQNKKRIKLDTRGYKTEIWERIN